MERKGGLLRNGEEYRVDWSIQEVARMAGTTSRTLRHYDSIGLLPPSRVGSNGYRRYDCWGRESYATSDRWWRSLDDGQKRSFQTEHEVLRDEWDALQRQGLSPEGPEVQEVARRHAAWIAAGSGNRQPDPQMLAGLADMYAADERFAVHYTREFASGAQFVRDALVHYARHLAG